MCVCNSMSIVCVWVIFMRRSYSTVAELGLWCSTASRRFAWTFLLRFLLSSLMQHIYLYLMCVVRSLDNLIVCSQVDLKSMHRAYLWSPCIELLSIIMILNTLESGFNPRLITSNTKRQSAPNIYPEWSTVPSHTCFRASGSVCQS